MYFFFHWQINTLIYFTLLYTLNSYNTKQLQHETATPTSEKYFEYVSRFDFAVETNLYFSTYYLNRF